MKPTNKQILTWVKSVGGLAKLQEALSNGAKLVSTMDEALTVKTAELQVAAEANEGLQSKLDEANTLVKEKKKLLESNVAQRKSGHMFKKSVTESTSNQNPQTNSLTTRLINNGRKRRT